MVTLRLLAFLGLHLHSVVAGEAGFNAVPYGGLDDGRIYYESARLLAEGESPKVNNSYPVVLSWLFRLGVDQIWLIKFANTLAGIAAVLVLARLAAEAGRRAGDAPRSLDRTVLLLAGLFPAAAFWSSNSLMRDAWIFLLVSLALWWMDGVLRAARGRSARLVSFVAAAAVCGLLGSLRWYAVGILAISFAITAITMNWQWLTSHRAHVMVLSMPIGFVVAYAGNELVDSLLGVRPLDYRDNPLLDGGSELEIDFRSNGLLLSIPLYVWSVVSNAFGPFPWQARTPLQLVPFLVELPFQVLICLRLWRHRATTSRTAHLLWVFGLVWLLTLGLWNDSLGNATRIRVVGWMALTAAAGAAGRSPGAVRTSGAHALDSPTPLERESDGVADLLRAEPMLVSRT